ncbi:hypothetical protein LWF01_10990 [Saxibacter everestensis]|uniref:Uncharacterized protein n=1 Tax=Saxibacter everestensis TaxID=2909229 RepID=A0ABY8QNX9_9MICO|nr:hypothetical protein LWF01_10990 [Brevibacteriaceae bacterium ZFBP1038]
MQAEIYLAASWLAQAATPSPSPTSTVPDDDQVSPGLPGFLTMFALAVVVILLARGMTKRIRRVKARGEAEEAGRAEAEEARRAKAEEPGTEKKAQPEPGAEEPGAEKKTRPEPGTTERQDE